LQILTGTVDSNYTVEFMMHSLHCAGYQRSLDKSLNMLDSDLDPSREQTFEWIHKTVMDAELPDDIQAAAPDMIMVTPEIHEPSKSVIRQAAAASTAPPAAARVNLSATKDITMQGASAAGDDHIPQVEDHDHADQQRQINDGSFTSRRNPNIRAWKRDMYALVHLQFEIFPCFFFGFDFRVFYVSQEIKL
jgi:hypothetical protein